MSQRPEDSGKLNSMSNLVRVDNVVNYYESKDGVVSKIKLERKKSAGRFFVESKRPDRPAFLTKKNIESRSYESNIARLNDELKKTGMLSEKMTTSTVLVPTETQPYIPPTTSFVPDANGLTDTTARESFSAQPTYGGDESDSSTWDTGWNSNAYLLNPNELDGETNRPLTYAPDKTPAGASGLVYGSFYFGTAIGYIDENNVFQTVLPGSITGDYTAPNQTGLSYPEGSPQRENYERQVSYYNAHLELVDRFGGNPTNKGFIHRDYTSYVNVWVQHVPFHHGSFENWTSSPKKSGFILRQAEVPTGVSARSKYTSDPGQPRTIVLNRLEDPNSPEFYPGDFSRYLANLLNLGKRAFDYLSNKSEQILSNQTVKDITNVLTGLDDSALGSDIILDLLQGTNDNVILPIFQKLGQSFSQAFGIKAGLVMSASLDIRNTIQNLKFGGDTEVFLRGGDFPAIMETDNEVYYAANLAASLMQSIGTGRMVMINDSNLSPSLVGSKLTSSDIKTALSNHEVQDGAPKPLSTDADSILNPTNKETYFGGKGFGGEGGSILEPYISEDGTPMLRNTADKFLRVGGDSGEYYDITTQQFTDIPSPSPSDSKRIMDFASDRGLYELIRNQDGNQDLTYDQFRETLANDPELLSTINNITAGGKAVFDLPLSAKGIGATTGFVNGSAIGSLIYAEVKNVFGGRPVSDLDSKGGRGHVRRETNISINDLNPEQQKVFMNELDKRGIEYNKNWNTVNESFFISEGWQSPDHTNIEKDQKTRWFSPNAGTDSKKWFDPEQVAPAYPKNPPPGMINGYSVKSNLAPKFVEKGPAIKLTKKDLLRNHRLKDSEVEEMMETINRLNEFLAKHPEELIYARSRYPKHDPRLAELNWKQDEMKRANDEYIERQFPINKTVFKRTQEAIKRNIELTDPKSFKITSTPIRHQDVTENKVRSIKKYMKPVKKTKPAFLRKKGKPNS